MSRRALPVSGTGITSRWVAGGTAIAAAITVAGAATLPAQSATEAQCPDAFPVAELAAGQAVSGLTVSSGTTPEGFAGSVLGVLHDGIAPGLDMIMVRLTSPEIERVGIWAGMSGSPVYAADGRLIGAVAYGLAAGPSTVAGLTPAADMQEMLTGSGEAPSGASTNVEIPDGMAARMVRSGAVRNAEVDEGMSQLRLPVGVSGLASQKRLRQFAKRIDIDNARLMRAGAASPDAAGPSTLVPGGNMVSSISYGDVSFSAVGTATAVCGTQVLGFGHPMLWTGPTTLTLHGAEALYIQEDPTFAGFKVANVGPPIGTVDQDRLPGIVGVEGALPATSDIRSTVTLGSRGRYGESHVSLPDWVPDIGFGHLLSNQDRVFDGIGKGGARLAYTIRGIREDGRAFTLQRSDLFADPFDISFASAADVADSLFMLEFNGIEDIRIDDVDVDSAMTRRYDHYVLEHVQVRVAGRWTKLNENRTLRVRAGAVKRFRALLDSADSGPRRVLLEVLVPARTGGRTGLLQVFGGNGFFAAEGFSEGGQAPSAEDEPTFDDILRMLRRQPANNDVVADLSFFNRRGDATHQVRDRVVTELVVDGGIAVQVRSVR